jgi:tetratricopeptide (TPR) repeat protein
VAVLEKQNSMKALDSAGYSRFKDILMRNDPKTRLFRNCAITFTLVVVGSWLLHNNWQLRQIRLENYSFNADEARKLKNFPGAQYDHGMRAWLKGDYSKASQFFRQTVSKDPFYIDAWLRLAESEAALGHLQTARKILMFTDFLTTGIGRWQWPQMLLARDLGVDEIFLKNANKLLGHQKLSQDTLQLLDLHYQSDTASVVDVLQAENLVHYLKWLMRWKRVDDTGAVWQRIVKDGQADPEVVSQYTHFLVQKKKILAARDIWHKFNGTQSMTNAGFEKKITRRGFDWRYSEDKQENWEIRRVNTSASEQTYVLRIWFAGEKNISFHHLYQIVPVDPLQSYRLSYNWKSKWITTDQGPFVEIYGYDQKGLYRKGPMIMGTNLWQTASLEFTPPGKCHAVVVRLCRLKSHRFDSKIAGTLWLDDFKLEKLSSANSALLMRKSSKSLPQKRGKING